MRIVGQNMTPSRFGMRPWDMIPTETMGIYWDDDVELLNDALSRVSDISFKGIIYDLDSNHDLDIAWALESGEVSYFAQQPHAVHPKRVHTKRNASSY